MAQGEIIVAVDGEGVTPETVDPRALLRLGLAYFEFLEKVSQWKRTPLSMRGIEIIDKCVGVRSRTEDAFTTELVVDFAHLILTKNQGPAKIREAAKPLKQIMASLPRGYTASVHTGERMYPLRPKGDPEAYYPLETRRIRGKLITIGGEDVCKAVFRSPSEPAAFSLSLSEDNARELAKHFHDVLHLEFKTRRNPHGRIERGELVAWSVLPKTGDDLETLAQAFASVKDQWGAVPDKNKALDRDED